jgi:hypothetical protein
MAIFLLYSYMVERVKESSEVSFIRALIPLMNSPPLQPNHLLKVILGFPLGEHIHSGHNRDIVINSYLIDR